MLKASGDIGEVFASDKDTPMSSSATPACHEVQAPILLSPPDSGEVTHQAKPGQVYFMDSMAPDLAQFDRDGSNLVIHQPYGGAVVLRDFLTLTEHSSPPALTLSDGVLIQVDEIKRRMWGDFQENSPLNSNSNSKRNTHDGVDCNHVTDFFAVDEFDLLDEEDLEFPERKSNERDDALSGEKQLDLRLNEIADPFERGPGGRKPDGRETDQDSPHVATKIVLGLEDDDDGKVIDRPAASED